MVTNLAIDRLRSAQHRREQYVGPYLPEPLVDDDRSDPAAAAELADSLTLAFLVMLDELTPIERAVLLLHDVFGYAFDEVAAAVGPFARRVPATGEPHAQEARPRARRAPAARRRARAAHGRAAPRDAPRAATSKGSWRSSRPTSCSSATAAPTVTRRAARWSGRDRVARFLANLRKRMVGFGADARVVNVNGGVGLVFVIDGRPESVMSFSFAPDGRVNRIYNQLNPEKLKHLASSSPARPLSRSRRSGAARGSAPRR